MVLPDSMLLGDGVFETFRIYNGQPFRLAEHLSRLRSSAEAVGILDTPPHEELKVVVVKEIERTGLSEARCRVSLFREAADIIVSVKPPTDYAPELYERGIKSVILWERLSIDQPPLWVKSASCQINIIGRLNAMRRGAQEGFFLTEEGMISEGCFSNLFIVRQHSLITPPTDYCLPGITRAEVLSIAEELEMGVSVSEITESTLLKADEVFITSSLAELLPVVGVNEQTIGAGIPGPIYKTLHARYRVHTQHDTKGTSD